MSKLSFDPKEFRNVLGAFTTGITIVTARSADGEPVGVTANSFNSVSLNPPLVLWSLAKNAASLDVFNEAEYFAIHILAADQEDLSNRFAQRGEDKFAGLDIENGAGNAPLLKSCTVRMQCKTAHRYEGGDHIIFVGEVIDFDQTGAAPLVFQAGKYALASRKAPEAPVLVTKESEDDFLGYLLWRAYFQFHKVARSHDVIEEHSYVEFLALVTLYQSAGITLESLAEKICCDGAAEDLTKAVSSLIEQGFIEFSNEKISLTAKGLEKTRSILDASKSTEAAFWEKLGAWESVTFKNLLKQFVLETDPGLPHLWDAQKAANNQT